MAKTYYDELGLEPTATAAQIKRAYRKLATEHHPDAEGGNDAAWLKLQAAYDVLSDLDKRTEYDRKLQSALDPTPESAVGTAAAAATMARAKTNQPKAAAVASVVGPKRYFHLTIFGWFVALMIAGIVILGAKLVISWSGGIGPSPSTVNPNSTPIPSPSPSPSPSPTDTPTDTPSPSPSPTDTPSPSPLPTDTPLISPLPSPTP